MRDCDTMLRLELSLAWTAEAPETDVPLPSRAERGTWEGRTARRPEGPSTGRGWASVIPLLLLLFSLLSGSIQLTDRDERGGREAGAGAPASPAPGASPPAGHPAFQTGVVYVEPDLRDEVQAYWQAYAAWERTRQGPPPREPRVSVRVDHADKPSTAARLRERPGAAMPSAVWSARSRCPQGTRCGMLQSAVYRRQRVG
ncbi:MULTISPECIES: hypothetical protein [Sorangium]|uniref:Uncharacterized protein n=1 Tax=Sorangium cellulosum TaxID=56 RepID=A0A4P2QH28_SORCE|nr:MULTISPECIES: hypothetical protein [Sorangium]AUX29204.1 uncharacterized protein SOCE836_012920 [Sorangium cellulosum]WCQ88596.1 hypothetical protein NQZ70_01275 [Sorangium sp. Soce836]